MNFLSFTQTYLPMLLHGLLVTVEVTSVGILFGLVLGVIAALGRISTVKIFKVPSRIYIWVIRGTPLLVQLFLIYYGLPQLGVRLPAYIAAVIALAVNSGAYIAEIIRAGVESIDIGQMEAAESLGMRYAMAMRRIIFPQAYKRLLPPLANEFVALLKDSSLVSTIAMADLMRVGQTIYSSTFLPMDSLILVAILYLLLTTVVVFISGQFERRLGARG